MEGKETATLRQYLRLLARTPVFSVRDVRLQRADGGSTNVLTATVRMQGRPVDYSDPSERVRNFCTVLALEMRELVGHNVFFDIQKGTLVVFARSE